MCGWEKESEILWHQNFPDNLNLNMPVYFFKMPWGRMIFSLKFYAQPLSFKCEGKMLLLSDKDLKNLPSM